MLRLRVITALLLGSLLIGIILLAPYRVFTLFLVCCIFAGAWEWAALSGAGHALTRTVYGIILITMLLLLDGFATREWLDLVVVLGVVWWCVAFLMVFAYQQGRNIVIAGVIPKLISGILVLLPSSISLLLLYQWHSGTGLLLLFFLLIWLVDSSAYFSGRKFGKHRLAERVSPGKTWEGVAGSLVIAALLAIGYQLMIDGNISVLHVLMFTLLFIITTLFSIVGDLFESLLKRQAGVKDSGCLLPGHGGVLDRIDSMTAAAPVFLLGFSILGGRP